MDDTTKFFYYEDSSGVIMATPARSIVNIVQSGTDITLFLAFGLTSTVPNTTVAEFLKNTRKITT